MVSGIAIPTSFYSIGKHVEVFLVLLLLIQFVLLNTLVYAYVLHSWPMKVMYGLCTKMFDWILVNGVE